MSDQPNGSCTKGHRPTTQRPLDQLGRLDLACRTHTDTLVVTAGSPGDPATNDLRAAILASVHAPGRTVLEIDATTHGTPHDLITAVIDALAENESERILAEALPDATWRVEESAPLIDLLADLGHLRAASDADVYVVVTHPQPDPAHQVFGVMRDAVWEVGLTWIVITGPTAAAEIVRPPADAFFPMRVNLP